MSVIAAGLSSLVGMSLAIIAHTAIMEERPARGIGVAFILWQADVFMLLLAGDVELNNPIFIEACVVCAVAWVVFRLPPFKREPPHYVVTSKSCRIAGIAIVRDYTLCDHCGRQVSRTECSTYR